MYTIIVQRYLIIRDKLRVPPGQIGCVHEHLYIFKKHDIKILPVQMTRIRRIIQTVIDRQTIAFERAKRITSVISFTPLSSHSTTDNVISRVVDNSSVRRFLFV